MKHKNIFSENTLKPFVQFKLNSGIVRCADHAHIYFNVQYQPYFKKICEKCGFVSFVLT